jgi:hypothetical protein
MMPSVSDALQVRFSPPEHGWLDVAIVCPPDTVTFTASYTPRDSVSELAAALIRVARADGVAEVVWNQEPDEMTTVFRRRGAMVELRVDAVSHSQRTSLITHHAAAAEIVRAFAEALDRVRTAPSEFDYEDAWRHAFPHEAVDRLMQLRGG